MTLRPANGFCRQTRRSTNSRLSPLLAGCDAPADGLLRERNPGQQADLLVRLIDIKGMKDGVETMEPSDDEGLIVGPYPRLTNRRDARPDGGWIGRHELSSTPVVPVLEKLDI